MEVMSWRKILSILIAINCFLLGCEKKEEKKNPPIIQTTPPKVVKIIGKELQEKRIYDDKGDLLPQNIEAFGVVLPRGAKLIVKNPIFQKYIIRAPSEKVKAFFLKRVKTYNISRLQNNSWELKDVTPLPPGDKTRKLDIKILYRGEETEFILIDRTSLPTHKVVNIPPQEDPTPQVILKKYKRELQPGESPPSDTF